MGRFKNKQGGVNNRRLNVISRLEQQLKDGTRPVSRKIMNKFSGSDFSPEFVSSLSKLQEGNITRINNELKTLRSRVSN